MVVHVVVLVLMLPIVIEGGGFKAFKFEQFGNVHIVDRFELVRYNKEYLRNASIVTFKYNRTTTAMNLTAFVVLELESDMEIVLQTYKFLSNEYRLFPIRFQINVCDAIHENAAGVGRLRECGNFKGCPIKKNTLYHICNFLPDGSKFPPLIPEGRYKTEFTFSYHRIEVAVANAYGTVAHPIPIPDK